MLSTTPLAAISFGPYVAWWAAVPFLILFFVWVRLLTWIDKDTRRVLLPREPINAGMMAAVLLGVAAFFLLPGLGLALGVFFVVMVASLGTYLGIRSKKSDSADLKASLAEDFGLTGKLGGGKEEVSPVGDFTFTPKVGPAIGAPDAEDPNFVGYNALASVLVDPMIKGAETVELIPAGSDQAASRFVVDGVAYEGTKIDKAQASEAIALIKRCFGGDVDERRKPQTGKFKMTFAGRKHEVAAKTQGSSAGEAARLEFDVAKRYQAKIEEMGFVADQLQFVEDNRDAGGLVLLAMPKGQGLTSLQYAMLRTHDAFVSQIVTLERDAPIDMEGVTQNSLATDAPAEEETHQVEWLTSQLPGVALVSQPQSKDSARALIDFASEEHRVYVGIRAGDVFEAIEAWRKVVGNDELAMRKVRYVVAGRVFRRLCDQTKIPYAPEEKLLRSLGMSPSRVTELYKPGTGMLRDAKGNEIPDEWCHGLGYKGRFGVYELFNIDDEVRAAVASKAGAQALRTLFRKQKRKYLQEQALVRVETGDTSVQEFLRVLKPAEERRPPSSRSASSAKPASAPANRSQPNA